MPPAMPSKAKDTISSTGGALNIINTAKPAKTHAPSTSFLRERILSEITPATGAVTIDEIIIMVMMHDAPERENPWMLSRNAGIYDFTAMVRILNAMNINPRNPAAFRLNPPAENVFFFSFSLLSCGGILKKRINRQSITAV
ncbi:hypothetical protein ADMFC3_18770 [Geovibrio sp. ADMFC3]